MSNHHLMILFVSVALILGVGQCDLVDDICSKSNNPSLCEQVLGNSRGQDARGLAKIALDKANTQIGVAINEAKAVSGFKQIIDTCIEVFNEAEDNLEECKPLIPSGSPSDLQTKASAALTDVSTCADEFGGKEPESLKKANDQAYTLVQLFLIIVNTL